MKILSKEQYCYSNNLTPELYESVEEAAKWLNWRDKVLKVKTIICKEEIKIPVKNLDN